MAKDSRELEIKITAKDKTKKAVSSTNRGLDSIEKQASRVNAALTALGVAAVATFAIRAAAQTQKFAASLETVTGSAQAASRAFSDLQEFAATTPFQLNQVVDGFIKLKGLGLDPSIESLRSYGNTAAALGKDLNQFIEAVADASTAEFERLKEFGIRAKNQGDTIAFTFQNVTTVVENNSRDITAFLDDIGNTQFAGAIEKQSRTLGGALSNLEDTLFTTGANLGEKLSPSIIELISGFQDLTDETDDFDAFFSGIGKVFDTVAISALTTATFVSAVGDSLGAVGAALSFLIEGEFGKASDTVNNFVDSIDNRFIKLGGRIERINLFGLSEQPTTPQNADEPGPQNTGTAPTSKKPEQQPGLEAFRAQQENRFIEIRAERYERELEMEAAQANALKEFQLQQDNELTALRVANIESAEATFRGITLTEEQKKTDAILDVERQRIAQINLLQEEGLITKTQAAQAEIEIEKQKNEEILRLHNETNQQKLNNNFQLAQGITSTLVSLTSINKEESKKAFETNKIAAISNAIVSTAQGVAGALGEQPWSKANFATAAAVAAAGAAQIASISSQEFGGGGNAQQPQDAGVSSQNRSQVAQPQQTNQSTGSNTTVIVEGNLIGEEKWIEEKLHPALRDINERNATVT